MANRYIRKQASSLQFMIKRLGVMQYFSLSVSKPSEWDGFNIIKLILVPKLNLKFDIKFDDFKPG